MAFAAADITKITNVTYSASSDPTSTQVADTVTACKRLWQSVANAAPNESDEGILGILGEIGADLISNYLRQKMLSNPSNMAGTVPDRRDPMPDSRRKQIQAIVTTEFDDSGSSFSFAW
jgi:hypothetical protein